MFINVNIVTFANETRIYNQMAKETIAIRLDPDTIKKIKTKADKDQRTVSDYLRIKIEELF